MIRSSAFLLVAAVFATVLAGCGGTASLQNQTLTTPTIDGVINDWPNGLQQMDDKPVSMAVATSDTMLYVALASNDPRTVRATLYRGLVVWVDPAGGQAKTYGVQFPLREERPRNALPPSERDQPQMADRTQLVVIQGEQRTHLPAQHATGIRASFSVERGSMVYELAIPVAHASRDDTSPEALRASLGNRPVGVGVVMPDVEGDRTTPYSMTRRSGVSGRVDESVSQRRRRQQREARRQAQQRRQFARMDLKLWTTVQPGS